MAENIIYVTSRILWHLATTNWWTMAENSLYVTSRIFWHPATTNWWTMIENRPLCDFQNIMASSNNKLVDYG